MIKLLLTINKYRITVSFSTFLFCIFWTFQAKSTPLQKEYFEKRNEKVIKKKEQIILLTEKGKKYFDQENYQKSLEYLIKAKNLNPRDLVELAPYNRAFSDLFKKIGANNIAIIYLKKVIKTSKEPLLRYYSYSDIGALFLTLNKNDSALFYFQKQQLQAEKYMNDYVAEASAWNNQGLALMKMNRIIEANSIFQKAFTLMEVNKNVRSKDFSDENFFKYAIVENSARCYYLLKNYVKVIEVLEYSKQYLGSNDIDENNRILMLAYLKVGNALKAKSLLHRLILNSNNLSLIKQKKLLEIKLDFYLELNLTQNIKTTFLTLNEINQSVKIQENVQNNQIGILLTQFLVNEAELNSQREKIKKQLIEKELFVQKQQNSIYEVLTFFLVLFAILGIYLIHFYSKNKKKALEIQKDRLLLQSQEQAHKIKIQETNLIDLAIGLNKNYEYEQNIVSSLAKITEAKPNSIQSEIKSLLAEIKQKQFIDKDVELLLNDSISILEPFRLALLEKHPTLIKSEIQLCYFIRLNLSNKEIALLKNVTANSVKIFKNRLRKKLSYLEETNLVDYLKSF